MRIVRPRSVRNNFKLFTERRVVPRPRPARHDPWAIPRSLDPRAVLAARCRCSVQFAAGADAELGVYVAQVPFDRARGQEQLGADLWIGTTVPRQPGDLGLLGGQRGGDFGVALAYRLASGEQFAACALGERFHADRGEHVVGRAQLLARVDAPALAAQPLPVQQMRAGEIWAQLRPAQPVDCLAITALGVRALAEQRLAARV